MFWPEKVNRGLHTCPRPRCGWITDETLINLSVCRLSRGYTRALSMCEALSGALIWLWLPSGPIWRCGTWWLVTLEVSINHHLLFICWTSKNILLKSYSSQSQYQADMCPKNLFLHLLWGATCSRPAQQSLSEGQREGRSSLAAVIGNGDHSPNMGRYLPRDWHSHRLPGLIAFSVGFP